MMLFLKKSDLTQEVKSVENPVAEKTPEGFSKIKASFSCHLSRRETRRFRKEMGMLSQSTLNYLRRIHHQQRRPMTLAEHMELRKRGVRIEVRTVEEVVK